MVLTIEKLRQIKACEPGIKYMERFFPNGAELVEIINARHIPKDFLHWGKDNLSVTEEELAAYCDVCKIVNTTGFWYSENVLDSLYVIESSNITRSERIFRSKDVEDSQDIVASEVVTKSAQVFTASMISYSSLIASSTNISESRNVCFSKTISRGVNIYNSKYVFNSSEIIKSENVTDSYFCQNCKNIKHCMFCSGIEDAEYYLFNRPVDKEQFELFVEQYKRFMQAQLNFSLKWPENLIKAYSPTITQKFDEWYKPIPERFWKWTRTLPGFDSMLIYNITMLPEILIDN